MRIINLNLHHVSAAVPGAFKPFYSWKGLDENGRKVEFTTPATDAEGNLVYPADGEDKILDLITPDSAEKASLENDQVGSASVRYFLKNAIALVADIDVVGDRPIRGADGTVLHHKLDIGKIVVSGKPRASGRVVGRKLVALSDVGQAPARGPVSEQF